MEVGLANPIEQQQETSFSDFDTFTEQETVQPQVAPEPSFEGDTFRSIFGMEVFDETAKRIGKAKQVGVDSNQELVLVVSDVNGNDINIKWNRIGTVGEVIFLGSSGKVAERPAEIPAEIPAGQGLRCPSCNFDNKPDSKFCETCGDKLL